LLRRSVPLIAAVLVLALGVSGCRSLTGRPVGRWVDDQAITASVKTRLATIRTFPSTTHVKVDTFEGTVYLSGVVDSDETKRRMEALAREVEHVAQVVTNLTVRQGRGSAPPSTTGRVVAVAVPGPHPLQTRLPGLARVDGDGVRHPQGPYRGYDRAGKLVATIYTVSMRDLAQHGLEDLVPSGAGVDHVAIYSIATDPDVPQPQYHVVLWHVSRTEAARLR
jgi:hypothetical protein